MKPAPFDYVAATSSEHALDLLAGAADAKVLAGGQSLLPVLSMRLGHPEVPTLREGGSDKTLVQVETDLDITGKPAQFGRGMLQEVAGRIIGVFAEQLEAQLVQETEAPAADAPAEPLDLLKLTGSPLLKRGLPVAAGAVLVVGAVTLVVRRLRR